MGPINVTLEIILNIILFYMVFLLSTIVHELGHGLPALILTKKNVRIMLGRNNKILKELSLGRLDIHLKDLNPFVGFTYWEEAILTNFKKIVILAGGPIFSAVFGIGLLLLSRNIGGKLLLETIFLKEMLTFAGNYHLFIFISTSVPIIYPKWWPGYSSYPSDGYQILKLLKTNKAV